MKREKLYKLFQESYGGTARITYPYAKSGGTLTLRRLEQLFNNTITKPTKLYVKKTNNKPRVKKVGKP